MTQTPKNTLKKIMALKKGASAAGLPALVNPNSAMFCPVDLHSPTCLAHYVRVIITLAPSILIHQTKTVKFPDPRTSLRLATNALESPSKDKKGKNHSSTPSVSRVSGTQEDSQVAPESHQTTKTDAEP